MTAGEMVITLFFAVDCYIRRTIFDFIEKFLRHNATSGLIKNISFFIISNR